jgi:long-chain fatty acid transport protein
MFWNPATMTQIPGMAMESAATGILPKVDEHPIVDPFGFGGASDVGNPALLMSGYASKQISPNLWLGVSLNTPFGLSTNYNDPWAGRNYGLSTSLSTSTTPPPAWRCASPTG